MTRANRARTRGPSSRAPGWACAATALALVWTSACAPAAPASAPATSAPESRVVEDDYARALAEARATRTPLVAVTGAAWCDACRELRAALAEASASRACVWLAVDVERDANAKFVARFASEAQPVVWVIDPATETALVWRGTLSPGGLSALARRGAEAMAGSARGDAAALAAAMRADAAGDADAGAKYRALFGAAGDERVLAIAALVSLLAARSDAAECARIAEEEAARLPPEAAASVVATGLACNASTQLVEAARRLVVLRVSPGDASALFEQLVADDRRRGDAEAAARDARAWLALLDAQSRAARSAAARASLDGARLAAHLALGEPDAAVPDLARSERDLPRDYAPPARLARAFAAARRWDDAERAVDRAFALAYGPYRVALLAHAVDLAIGAGDEHAALRRLDEALVLARALPLYGAYARLRATLEIRRAEWGRATPR